MSISFLTFTEHSTVYNFTKDFLSEDQLFHLHLLAMFWSLVSFKTTSRFVSFPAVTANNHLGLNQPVGKKYPRISKMFPKLWWRDKSRWRSVWGLSKQILDPQHSNYIFLSCFMRSFWLDWTLASLLKKWPRFLFTMWIAYIFYLCHALLSQSVLKFLHLLLKCQELLQNHHQIRTNREDRPPCCFWLCTVKVTWRSCSTSHLSLFEVRRLS